MNSGCPRRATRWAAVSFRAHACSSAPSPDRPRIGEIWAFVDDNGRVVVHRCMWNRSVHALRFRGDAVCSLDAPVSSGHLIGRVAEGRRRCPSVGTAQPGTPSFRPPERSSEAFDRAYVDTLRPNP